jgi:hypothetical protein
LEWKNLKQGDKTMPIKELMTLSTGILIAIFIANPLHFREAVRKVQIQILREVARTDNWGTPIPIHTKNQKLSGR